jgi:hypothetical protein
MKKLWFLMLILLVNTNVFAAEKAVAKPLTNQEVIKLVKLGIGDDAVIAKIRQTPTVNFELETDDLGSLKAAGVSGKVIAAMLDRSSSVTAPAQSATEPRAQTPIERSSTVRLVTNKETLGLTSLIGSSSSTWIYVAFLFWFNFPGLHATHHITDRNPSFLIAADHDPRSRYYIVRLDVNTKGGDRSLKMGKSRAFSFTASNTPDSEWTFPYEGAEEKTGVWKLALRAPLLPGEYGVFVVQAGELYDFGVD